MLTFLNEFAIAAYGQIVEIPYEFKAGKVVVELASAEASLHDWRRAGWLVAQYEIDGETVEGLWHRLYWGKSNCSFEPLLSPFRLRYQPHPWIRDAIIRVWTWQDDWTTLPLINGWEASGYPQALPAYQQDGGKIRLRGACTGSTATSPLLAELPPHARPGYLIQMHGLAISPDGAIENLSAYPNWLSLDGIAFEAI